MSGRRPRLGGEIAELDAERFVGRRDVLDVVTSRLAPGSPSTVLHVHGPGGIGKSALLREIDRRARALGRTVHTVDGRIVATSTDALTAALDGAADEPDPVLLIDAFEHMSALAPVLRDRVLPALPAGSFVVLAGRVPPDPIWFDGGWEHLSRDVRLRPLHDDEADELLARLDVVGPAATRSREWAKGFPLALQVAAVALPTDRAELDPLDLAEAIARRLVGDELTGVDPEVLEVAVVARAVDRRLLTALVPGPAGGAGFDALRRLSVSEPLGPRLTLHEVVRAALRAELIRRDGSGYRRLVCRLADELHARILTGEPALLRDLVALFEDPVVRWAFSAGDGHSYRAGRPEPGDEQTIAGQLGAAGTTWWAGVARFFRTGPEAVTVVRTAAGRITGFGIVVTPASAPTWADEDAVLSRVLAHAGEHVPDGAAVLFRDTIDLESGPGGDPGSQVVGLLNYPSNLAAAFPRARAFYGVVEAENAVARELARAIGAVRLPELDILDGERELHTYLLDHGPGRLVGTVRSLIYAEQDAPPPAPADRRTGTDPEAVRDALRRFHDPVALAANPLAEGYDVGERAESVRRLLRTAVGIAFGDSAVEQQLRHVVERGYLDPTGGHGVAMAEAHVSHTTYFRRLNDALSRIGAAIERQQR